MRKIAGYLMLGMASLWGADALASGYQLNEYSANGLGRAFAGSGVVGDDYSAIAYNPAGMSLKDSGMQVGVSFVEMYSDARGRIADPATDATLRDGPAGRLRLIKTLPHGFAQYKVNNELALGMGVYTPFGLATEYNSDWFGATHGIKTDLEVVDIATGFSYKIIPEISVGASFILRYVAGDIINQPLLAYPSSRNRMNLDGWGWGTNFGIMYEPTKNTRIGFSYRSSPAHTVKGDHEVTTPLGFQRYDGKSTMTLPSQFLLSGYHKLNDKFALTASARYTEWSIFDDFVMTSSMPAAQSIPERWKDAWTVSLGMDYYHDDAWTFRTGIAFDETPIPSRQFRTARIPDADRYWLSLGFSYKYENMTFDVGYAHLFMRKSESENRENGSVLYANYHSHSNMLSVQMQYDF